VPEIQSRDGIKGKAQKHGIEADHGREKLLPAYVSLYGVSDPDQIDRAVLYAVNPWLTNKALRKIGSISKPLLKLFSVDVGDVEIDPKAWNNVTDVVLCFDDLERCSIPVGDVLGRINQYVEHEHAKTIILCNEDAISADQKDGYGLMKEKVIGRSFHFTLDHAALLDALIEAQLGASRYREFLAQNRHRILDLFNRSESENIRILKHSLANLRAIVDVLHRESELPPEASQAMLRMILPLTFEYELRRATPKEIRTLATTSIRVTPNRSTCRGNLESH
jgi:hypothetical protein